MLLVKTKLDVSSIHGIGLFAEEFIRQGTLVWQLCPLIDLRFTNEEIEKLADYSREQIRKYSYREKHSGLYVLCGDDARFFNHSNDPNCFDVYQNESQDLTIARRDINAGDELTCDYKLFDQDLIDGKYEIPLAKTFPLNVLISK